MDKEVKANVVFFVGSAFVTNREEDWGPDERAWKMFQ